MFHIVNPTVARPFYKLITSGMSQKPMNVSEKSANYQFAELVICLPSNWNMDQNAWREDLNEIHYWPVRWLKTLARLPHEYGTWLGYYHTIPNGDPAQPYAPNTKLSGMMICPTFSLPRDFHYLEG